MHPAIPGISSPNYLSKNQLPMKLILRITTIPLIILLRILALLLPRSAQAIQQCTSALTNIFKP